MLARAGLDQFIFEITLLIELEGIDWWVEFELIAASVLSFLNPIEFNHVFLVCLCNCVIWNALAQYTSVKILCAIVVKTELTRVQIVL